MPILSARFASLSVCTILASVAAAQVAPVIERPVPLGLDSGEVAPPKDTPLGQAALVYSATVSTDHALTPWFRVLLHETVLSGDPAFGNGAYLIITSLHDGAQQRLDGDSISLWGYASAYFNGPAARLELYAFAGSGTSRVRVGAVLAGEPGGAIAPATICDGLDNRTPSADNRAARTNGGCTAWVFDDLNSSLLCAGHCLSAITTLVLFNVPPSLAGGGIQQPPPEDQYPVDVSSRQSLDGGAGNDWLYIGVLPNSNHGQLPWQRYGVRHELASAPTTTPTIRITGYGTASGVRNQVQQTHTGPFTSLVTNRLRYRVDTTGGNSGSPVINEATGRAVGIHTHGGCTNGGGSNSGTAIQHPQLQAALANPRGVCASGVGTVRGSLFLLGDRQNNFGTVNPAPVKFARVAQLGANWQGMAWSRVQSVFFAINSAGQLHTLSPQGEMTPLGMVTGAGGALLTGLAIEPISDTLYAIAPASGQLYTINEQTLEASPVGSAQGGGVRAIDFDFMRSRLCGIDTSAGVPRLVTIDTTTGARTPLGSLGSGFTIGDIAFDPVHNAFSAVNSVDGSLLRINALTGETTSLGLTGGVLGPSSGLASSAACRTDVDASGTLDPDDLADFVTCFFQQVADAGSCSAADFNDDREVNPDDLADFISAFFLGLC